MPSFKVGSADLREYLGETFHLLFVTHKFPGSVNDVPNLPNNSSSFAEAFLFPCNLILPEEHESDEYLKVGPSRRPKLKIRNSEEFETRPYQVPCLLTFRSNNHGESSLPGYLCHTDGCALEDVPYNQRSRRILLEFTSDSFCKYQLLHLGASYILRCSSIEGCEEIDCGKATINSQATLWSFSFSFATDGETVSGGLCQNELRFRPSSREMRGASDVHLHFPSKELALTKEETAAEAVKSWLIKLLPATNDVLSVSSCIQLMTQLLSPCSDYPQSETLPQGNLISICGNIENIHSYNCKSNSYEDYERPNIYRGKPGTICIHVYDDHHMVQICGDLCKYTYLVGMGPATNATFHRVLVTCSSSRWRKLVLTAVSYVVINSVKESGHQDRERIPLSSLIRCNILEEESFQNVPLALFSQLLPCKESMLTRFHCRVVTIRVLVLERHTQDFGMSDPRRNFRMPCVNIPLAGFVLDDGSSLCCCWVDAGRAETFLRLQETAFPAFLGRQKRLNKGGSKGSQDSIGYHLEKILKKHRRVTARNHGAVTDSSCQDFTFSVDSDQVFTSSEESLLRFLVLNASCGPMFNIVGHLMDSNALEQLGAEFQESEVVVRSMCNVWVREVAYVDHVKEARNLLHAIL